MIQVLLILWVIGAVLVVAERKTVRIIIYLGVFSFLSSICFFMFAAPDVAMAEVAVSAFTVIFYIVCLEKYYDLGADASDSEPSPHHVAGEIGEAGESPRSLSGNRRRRTAAAIGKAALPVCFAVGLFVLFVIFIPGNPASAFLKDRYVALFQNDVGGENAVTAIYLGYRVYDTLFEALTLLISVVAVAHLSWYQVAADGRRVAIRSDIALPIVRIVSPLMLLFGIYLIINGHMSPGGGFQGGVAIAAFFICRYIVFDITDIKVGRFITLEKAVYIVTVVVATIFVFIGAETVFTFFTLPKNAYLILMNALIGVKVACAFTIILYRYIAFERR